MRATDKIAKIGIAMNHMKRARDLLREAGADHAADYQARALKSAEGAIRNQESKRTTAATTQLTRRKGDAPMNETTAAPATKFEKDKHSGWSAETLFPMGPAIDTMDRPAERMLSINTAKGNRGLYSAAHVELHAGTSVSFLIGGDFRKTIRQYVTLRCTEKTVREVHAIALAQAPALLAEAFAYYAAQDEETARNENRKLVAQDIQTLREIGGVA